MSWITITEDDIVSALSGAEKNAVPAAALAAGQTSAAFLAECIAQVSDRVRGYVAACRSNTLGPAGTVPPRLKDTALFLIRHRILSRVPGLEQLHGAIREEEYKDAIRLLEQVASCDFAVEDPAGDATSGAQSNSPRITPRTRRFDRCSQEGL